MDLDEFRSILRKSGADVWSFIDSAISVAVFDYKDELKQRRDGIVEKLYASPPPPPVPVPVVTSPPPSRRCDESPKQIHEISKKDNNHRSINPSMTPSRSNDGDGDGDGDGDEDDDFRDQIIGSSIDEEQTTKILAIKEDLEDPNQTEESLVHLLQNLADMDISFNALKDTDIGRHVNRLRKNQSSDVRKLVKQLVRKWKELVDEWVKINANGGGNGVAASALIDGGDYSPPEQNPMRHNQNGHHHQVPDFAYSPNPHNGSSGSDKYNSEPEPKVKSNPRREPPPRLINASTSTQPNKQREQQDNTIDLERLDKARRRLQENYQEANNAKKQRTIQVMDIHELPKPKNSFFAKNKGGSQAKHW